MSGRGPSEQIMNVREIIEKYREFIIPVVMCFIDYAKVFGRVNWKKLFKVLREMGILALIVDLTESIYEFNCMAMRVYGGESE